MKGKPTITIGMMRRKVREVLCIRPGYGLTESQVREFVNELTGGGVSLEQLRDAIEWNISEKCVRSQYDEENERTVLFITEEGIARQNVK